MGDYVFNYYDIQKIDDKELIQLLYEYNRLVKKIEIMELKTSRYKFFNIDDLLTMKNNILLYIGKIRDIISNMVLYNDIIYDKFDRDNIPLELLKNYDEKINHLYNKVEDLKDEYFIKRDELTKQYIDEEIPQ